MGSRVAQEARRASGPGLRGVVALLCLLCLLLPAGAGSQDIGAQNIGTKGFSTEGIGAQSADQPPLTVPFRSVPPFMQYERDGARGGFFIALAEAISREIGVPLEFLDVPDIGGVVEAQVAGRSDMVAGIARLSPMLSTHVYSVPVASDVLRYAVLVENAARFESGPVVGLRIGIVPPTLGSEEAVLARNTPLPFVNVEAALLGLLKGEVDALLIPPPTVFRLAREAGVDGRIVFAGRPVRDLQRYVALHQGRADLMPAVNAAIARLEASGALARIRQRYSIEVPPPEPEVLRLPIAHAPPFGIIDDEGHISGYAVDLLRGLAGPSGLRFEFVPVPLADYRAALTNQAYDVIPFVLASDDLDSDLDLTIPIDTAAVEILVRAEDTGLATWQDLARARVGASPGIARVARQSDFAVAELREYATQADLEAALLSGEIEALMAVEHSLRVRGIDRRLKSIGAPPFTVANVIGLRPGLGAVRERLNAVIPGYLLSEDYAALRQRYFAPTVFWTQARLHVALALALGAFLLVVALQLRDRQRRRRHAFVQQAEALEREQAHARALQGIVDQLEQANREQAEFTYAVSHDLKSPANTLGMLIDVLSEEVPLDETGRALLADMARTNAHMRQLVDDVLAYSLVVEGEKDVEPVDLGALLGDIREGLAEALQTAGADLDVAALPVLRGTRAQLHILFRNLLSNALKFRRTDRPPIIRVAAAHVPGAMTITVTDNGIGIAPKHREKVFGLFQRLNSQALYEGTGLGLTICKRVMSNHDGTIRIETGIEGGTAVVLSFPEEAVP